MFSNLDSALAWLEQGVASIPCLPNTKVSMIKWSKYQNQLPTEKEIKRWFKNSSNNIALITGGITGLLVLDFDSIPLYHKWRKSHKNLVGTYTVSSPRPGKHLYFRTIQPTTSRIECTQGLDIKASGGYVIAPPSMVKWKFYNVANNADIITIDNVNDLLEDEWIVSRTEYTKTIQPRSGNGEALYEPSTSISGIKNCIPIYDLISSYTELQPSSFNGRWYIGICPVHGDNSPSLRVDTFSNKCYCWSSKCELHDPRGSDVVDFYMAMHGVDIATAIRDLAMQAGL